jgi:rare lipoprotein A
VGCIALAGLLSQPSIGTAAGAAAQSDDATPIKATRKHRTVSEPATSSDGRQRGNASFYSKRLSGHKTASGEAYDPNALTAAHRTLPLGTKVRVTNPKNDRSVVVTVNDRGPVPKGRMLDVSSAAADALGMKKDGVTRVETQVVGKTDVKHAAGHDADTSGAKH